MFKKRHYLRNVNYDTDDFVMGQANSPTSMMRYGAFSMAYNGCEIIAVYNAMRLLGKPMPLSEIVRDFEGGLHPLLFGVFGTKPCRVGRYLGKKGFDTEKKYRLDKLETLSHDGAVFIISYWTGRRLITPIHTVAVRCVSADIWEVYNRYNNTRTVILEESLADIIGNGRFICGYCVK